MKITFIGAGSTVFAKNIIGDIFLTPSLCDSTIALYDIDKERLDVSYDVLSSLNTTFNGGKARKHLRVQDLLLMQFRLEDTNLVPLLTLKSRKNTALDRL